MDSRWKLALWQPSYESNYAVLFSIAIRLLNMFGPVIRNTVFGQPYLICTLSLILIACLDYIAIEF